MLKCWRRNDPGKNRVSDRQQPQIGTGFVLGLFTPPTHLSVGYYFGSKKNYFRYSVIIPLVTQMTVFRESSVKASN